MTEEERRLVVRLLPGKEGSMAIANRAVRAGSGKPELADDGSLLAELLAIQDPEERELRALRGEIWAHGLELWHLARASFSNDIDEWHATISWSSTSSKLGLVALFAALESERKNQEKTWISSYSLLLFGASGGIALCLLLRLNGC